jgi:hypothetical protein
MRASEANVGDVIRRNPNSKPNTGGYAYYGTPYEVRAVAGCLGIMEHLERFVPLTRLEGDDWQLLTAQPVGEAVRYEEITLEDVKARDVIRVFTKHVECWAKVFGGGDGDPNYYLNGALFSNKYPPNDVVRIFRVHNMPPLPALPPREPSLRQQIQDAIRSVSGFEGAPDPATDRVCSIPQIAALLEKTK